MKACGMRTAGMEELYFRYDDDTAAGNLGVHD